MTFCSKPLKVVFVAPHIVKIIPHSHVTGLGLWRYYKISSPFLGTLYKILSVLEAPVVFEGARSSSGEISRVTKEDEGRRDNSYYLNACYKWFGRFALWLLCPVLNNTSGEKESKQPIRSQTAAKSGVRRLSPFHPFSRAFKCLSSFQLRAAFLPDNRRVTRCPLSR